MTAARRSTLVPGHFVERHGLMLLIALGESVLAIGVGLGTGVEAIGLERIAFAAISLLLATTLYWAYFGVGEDARAEAALDALPAEPGPGRRPRVVRLRVLGHPLRDRAQRRRPAPRPRAPDGPARAGGTPASCASALACSGSGSACSGSPWACPARCRAWPAGWCLGAVIVVGRHGVRTARAAVPAARVGCAGDGRPSRGCACRPTRLMAAGHGDTLVERPTPARHSAACRPT